MLGILSRGPNNLSIDFWVLKDNADYLSDLMDMHLVKQIWITEEGRSYLANTCSKAWVIF